MRERKSLKPNTDIRFANHTGGEMHYVVGEVIGMGGSCVVYDGYYINNAGTRNTVRIKECYPYKLHITREENGNLIVDGNEEARFEEYKERTRKSFDIANTFHQTSGLTNLTSNVFDRYEANNTVYIVSSYTEGSTLAETELESLSDAIRTVISVSKSVEKMHDNGYLYLDVKPENVLIYPETPDLIQLFDFDSVVPVDTDKCITDYRISYSMGFAPVEQKTGKMSQIGKHTDVYSIGALLFYLLFGRAPKATDCGFDVSYDYENLKWNMLYQQKVYKELTVFFNHTLQAYYKDRYQTVTEAIAQLKIIAKYADLPVPFICTGYVSNSGSVIGREKECREIEKWCSGNSKLLFVTGMGGIGKSTIVRKFASDNKERFDNLIYIQYKDNIIETVTDDMQFCINGYEKKEQETTREYFLRKLKAAKELIDDTESVLIVDNFSGSIDNDFLELLKVNWKVIVVTRPDMSETGYDCQKIEAFRNKEEQYKLFEDNMGRKIVPEEYRKLDRIIETVAGHTLALVLVARQIARSFIDIDTALSLVETNGFAGMAPEKVKYMQDGKEYYDRISAIIKAVYDVSVLSEDKKKCLKVLSLFDVKGIGVKEAREILMLESLDDIHELADLGWIELSENKVSMHPLIQETMHQIPWTNEYRKIAVTEMQMLFKAIKLNGKQEEYPKKLYERNIKIKQNMERSDLADKLVRKLLHKKGVLGEVTLERILSDEISQLPDYKKLRNALNTSKSVLYHCGKDSILSNEKVYKDLLFATLINSPKDQEEYVIGNCEKLFSDKDCINPYTIMELYDYVAYLLCQKSDYDEAGKYLDKAKSFAQKWNDNYIWGLYYDMLMDFYEELLNGAYYSEDEDEVALMNKMLITIDKAIHYMGKSKHEMAKNRYAKYVLGKAALMIRSIPEESRKIKSLITGTKKIIEKNTLDYAEVRSVYYMVWAWYYTLCEPEMKEVLMNLKEAAVINEARNTSELDEVDYFYIPAANMMCELGEIKSTLELLDEAYKMCDTHADEIPYIRKKLDLLEYQLQICYEEDDIEKSQKYLNMIDAVNQEAKEYDICKAIPDYVRSAIE